MVQNDYVRYKNNNIVENDNVSRDLDDGVKPTPFTKYEVPNDSLLPDSCS